MLEYGVEAKFACLLTNGGTAAVLLTTFSLIVIRDLMTGIIGGCLLATALAVIGRPIAEEGE